MAPCAAQLRSSTKVLFVCRRRFWESDDGIYGGGTYTDLPTGTTYIRQTMRKRAIRASRRPGAARGEQGTGGTRLAGLLRPERRSMKTGTVYPQLRSSASRYCLSQSILGGAFAGRRQEEHRRSDYRAGRATMPASTRVPHTDGARVEPARGAGDARRVVNRAAAGRGGRGQAFSVASQSRTGCAAFSQSSSSIIMCARPGTITGFTP